MAHDDELMSAEEFFGGVAKNETAPLNTGRARRKAGREGLFDDVKTKMVMRINGVSRAKALEIIASRAKKSVEGDKSGKRTGRPSGGALMSAEEFFCG